MGELLRLRSTPPTLQLAGLFSCAVVLSVLLWLGPFFYYLPKVRERAGVGVAGRRGHMPGYGQSALLLCPKAVLACINISSMRQMFFQMQELPQLWRISRVDFVRNGIPPRLPPPISQHPQPLPRIKANCHGPKFCNPPPICIPPNPFTQRQGEGWGLHPFRLEYL